MNKKVVSHKQLLAEKNTFVAGLANDLPCVLSMIACTLSTTWHAVSALCLPEQTPIILIIKPKKKKKKIRISRSFS